MKHVKRSRAQIKKDRDTQTSVRLSPGNKEALQKLASMKRISLAEYLRELVNTHVSHSFFNP